MEHIGEYFPDAFLAVPEAEVDGFPEELEQGEQHLVFACVFAFDGSERFDSAEESGEDAVEGRFPGFFDCVGAVDGDFLTCHQSAVVEDQPSSFDGVVDFAFGVEVVQQADD